MREPNSMRAGWNVVRGNFRCGRYRAYHGVARKVPDWCSTEVLETQPPVWILNSWMGCIATRESADTQRVASILVHSYSPGVIDSPNVS
jgi:hypothetical protein